MKIDTTPYSWICQLRLFGKDVIFGYFDIKAASNDAEDMDDVNVILDRAKDEL